MSFLNDPSFGFARGRRSLGQIRLGSDSCRIRFRSTSAFARDMGLTPGCAGLIAARYCEDGRDRVNVQIEGGPYCFGVLADEIMPDERRSLADP